MAHACNPVTWEAGVVEWLEGWDSWGWLSYVDRVSRAKFGVNMVNTEESEFSQVG